MILIVAILVFAGCSASDQSKRFPDQLVRESSVSEESAVIGPGGAFDTRIVGSLVKPIEIAFDGTGAVALIDFGATAPAECLFFEEDLDLAGALLDLSNSAFEAVSQQLGPVANKQVRDNRAYVIGESPALSVEWLYSVGDAGGHVKHRIASVQEHAVYCRHIQSGYSKSFARLFNGLVKHLRYRQGRLWQPFYTAVWEVRLSGEPVGIEKRVYLREGGDSVRMERRSSSLLPVDGRTLMSLDTMEIHFGQSDGTLINAVHVRSENGELVSHLALDPSGEGWVVSGTLQEKEYSATIERNPLMSFLGEAFGCWC